MYSVCSNVKCGFSCVFVCTANAVLLRVAIGVFVCTAGAVLLCLATAVYLCIQRVQ